jgi:F-box/TPR repeat protein Pof3
MHQKLQDKLLSKCYDPFSVFPYEIARMVVEHFDFRELV